MSRRLCNLALNVANTPLLNREKISIDAFGVDLNPIFLRPVIHLLAGFYWL
jgi:hypothetical protein